MLIRVPLSAYVFM